MKHGTPTSEAIDSTNKQPYIVLFAAEEDDLNNQFFLVAEEDDLNNQFFLVAEEDDLNNQFFLVAEEDDLNNQFFLVAEEDDLNNQFFLVVEGEFILECGNPATAVFNLMAAHYVFNLDYDPKAKDALVFIQEKVLKVIETGKKPKSATVAAHTAGILRYYED